MFSPSFAVLVVDDEPDVLSISKLVMRGFTAYGIPLDIYTAASKAEAVDLIKTQLVTQQGASLIAVAFVDVVMETDTAGLELCQLMRNELNNQMTTIYVRTGQPGVAPERSVIDQYDINGYFTKVEATEDKLYSLVKAGIRQYAYMVTSRVLSDVLNAMIAYGESRAGIAAVMAQTIDAIHAGAQGERHGLSEIRAALIVDGAVVAGATGVPPEEMLALREQLGRGPRVPLGSAGDAYVVQGNNLLMQVAAGPAADAVEFIASGTYAPPEFMVELFHSWLTGVAGLWKRAAS